MVAITWMSLGCHFGVFSDSSSQAKFRPVLLLAFGVGRPKAVGPSMWAHASGEKEAGLVAMAIGPQQLWEEVGLQVSL